MSESRPPFPPFTLETAIQKVRGAEDGWNSCNPERVSLAYTPESRWRNRSEFVVGRPAIVGFMTRKWARELDYRLIKEVWAWQADRIAVRFIDLRPHPAADPAHRGFVAEQPAENAKGAAEAGAADQDAGDEGMRDRAGDAVGDHDRTACGFS